MSLEQVQNINFVRLDGDPRGLLVPEGYVEGPIESPGVYVANRKLDSPSPGGLKSTLSAAANGSKARVVSIGWEDGTERGGLDVTRPAKFTAGKNYDTVGIHLTPEQIKGYYEGFANRVLWFMAHGLLDLAGVDPEYLTQYDAVNSIFAQEAVKYGNGHPISLQDYHLELAAEKVRELSPDQEIGQFIHIPWPKIETFAFLEKYGSNVPEKFLRGLLANDILGFQTTRDVANFIGCIRGYLRDRVQIIELAPDDFLIEFEGRLMNIGAFPISIDVQGIEDEAVTMEVADRAKEIGTQFPGELGLTVGRNEPSKKTQNTAKAIGIVHGRRPDKKKIYTHFIVNPGSNRDKMHEYQQNRREVLEEIDTTNGQHAEGEWKPIRYTEIAVTGTERSALWRRSKVGVYATIDGMNVVSVEHLFAGEPDVRIVVAKQAGISTQAPEFIIVDCEDPESIATGIEQALDMPYDEAFVRAESVRERYRRNTIFDWQDNFMRRFQRIRALRAHYAASN